MEMMATTLPGEAVHVEPRGREDPLPPPFAPGVRVLSEECPGELDPAGTATEVGLVLRAHVVDVRHQ